MARLVIMEGSQDPDYLYRDELRVTAAGDSTLRVDTLAQFLKEESQKLF